MGLWVLGLMISVRNRRDLRYSFLLICIIGITLSECAAVPFSTNYLRLYAVSMWVPACVTGLFPQFLTEHYLSGKKIRTKNFSLPGTIPVTITLCLVIVAAAVFGAPFIKAHPYSKPEAAADFCPAGEDMLITSVDQGSYIYLAEKSSLSAEYIPYFRLPYVRQHFHDTASFEMFDFTDALDTPTAIIRGIDLLNDQDALIFAPLSLVEGKSGYAQFCGKFINPPILRNDRFFIPSSVLFIEEPL